MNPVTVKWKTLRNAWALQDISLNVHAIILTEIEEPIWRSSIETGRIYTIRKIADETG